MAFSFGKRWVESVYKMIELSRSSVDAFYTLNLKWVTGRSAIAVKYTGNLSGCSLLYKKI